VVLGDVRAGGDIPGLADVPVFPLKTGFAPKWFDGVSGGGLWSVRGKKPQPAYHAPFLGTSRSTAISRYCGASGFDRGRKKLQFHLPEFPMVSEKDNVRQGFMEPARFRELLDAMPENLRTYLLFFYETGCRRGAAKQIIWDWVSLDEGLVRIPSGVTKNDAALPLPLSDGLVRMLKKQFRRDGDPVFVTVNFRKAFQAACVAVKLGVKTGTKAWQFDGLIPYDLRRSAVRNMKRAGVDETVAMKISGHKTNAMFRRYNITSVEDVMKAMGKVSNYNARKSASK
jgi:integrase